MPLLLETSYKLGVGRQTGKLYRIFMEYTNFSGKKYNKNNRIAAAVSTAITATWSD
jgi:hypothetical protein